MRNSLLTNFIPNCHDASALASASMDGPLPWKMRLQLRLHLLICDMCTRNIAQLKYMRVLMRRYAEAISTGRLQAPRLDATARARLQKALEQSGQ